jgi:hypothetical protein
MDNVLSQMREKFNQTQTELVQMLDASDLDGLHRPRDEEKWTFAIILAHLIEARTFMTQQAENLRKNPGSTVGRMLDNEQRVDAIIRAQHSDLEPGQLKWQLIESYEAVMRLFNSLSDAELQIACNHVRLGPMTLGEFLQRTIIDHDQTHVEQARAFLQA